MKQWREKMADKSGFTLVEVLAAFTIFVIAIVPLVQMLWVGNLVGDQALQKTVALNIAQGKMEEILAQGGVKQEVSGAFETEKAGYLGTITLDPWEELRLVTVRIDYCFEREEHSTEICCLLPFKD